MTLKVAATIYSVIALVPAIMISPHIGAQAKFSDWGEPTNLGCDVNSTSAEQGPAISKDGLSLFFGSMRSGGFGASDIWVAQRASVDGAWGPAVNLGDVVNTTGVENIPALSRDGHWLFFNSDRPGTSGGADIWASYREHVHDDFGWQPPVNLGAGANSAGFELGAAFLENEEAGLPLLFFGRGPTVTDVDIYVSELQSNGMFGDAVLVPELSSAQSDQRPSVRFDGLELFLGSNRPGSLGGNDIWVSTRETVFDTWDIPTNPGSTVNSSSGDMQPEIAADRLTLFFASNRPGGCGAFDLYVTTRTRR